MVGDWVAREWQRGSWEGETIFFDRDLSLLTEATAYEPGRGREGEPSG